MSDQQYEDRLAQLSKDIAAYFEPRWYRPIKRWRWKRHGAAITATKLTAALFGSVEPIVFRGERDEKEGSE